MAEPARSSHAWQDAPAAITAAIPQPATLPGPPGLGGIAHAALRRPVSRPLPSLKQTG